MFGTHALYKNVGQRVVFTEFPVEALSMCLFSWYQESRGADGTRWFLTGTTLCVLEHEHGLGHLAQPVKCWRTRAESGPPIGPNAKS
jgi:hypothetical protein